MIAGGDGDDVLIGGDGERPHRGRRRARPRPRGAGQRPDQGRPGQRRAARRAGRDRIRAGAGRDTAYGNAGNDTIRGQSGADRLFGNGGRNRIFGNAGPDTLVSALSKRIGDRLHGGRGIDRGRPTGATACARSSTCSGARAAKTAFLRNLCPVCDSAGAALMAISGMQGTNELGTAFPTLPSGVIRDTYG